MRKALRQTLTIARRDFVATVATPVFLLFLLAPLLMASISVLAGLGAAHVTDDRPEGAGLAMIVPAAEVPLVAAADTRLRALFHGSDAPPGLNTIAPAADPAGQARAALMRQDRAAVLYGPIGLPTILQRPGDARAADYLAQVAREALVDQRLGARRPQAEARRIVLGRLAHGGGRDRPAGFFAVFGIFFLTLFLAGQVVGTMAEERNNKVIEILAAAVPLEAVFLGKLLGMFGVAVLFVAFWGTLLSQAASFVPGLGAALGGAAPPIGWPVFAALFVAYFAMAYLLLGSVFLGVGAQATTPREIQMLSLPITITQVAMFALASAAASHPGGTLATVAEVFPLSSPFAMVGRAAARPGLWRHAAALAWQLLWVALFITLGARLFRRGVLQSGSARPWWRRTAAIDKTVS